MGHRSSSKAAQIAALSHHHCHPSRQCEEARDESHMKRHASTGDHQVRTPSNSRREREAMPSSEVVEIWLANIPSLHLDAAARSTDVANLPKVHYGRTAQGFGEETQRKSPYHAREPWRSGHSLAVVKIPPRLTKSTRDRCGRYHKKRPFSDDSSLLSVASITQHVKAGDEDPVTLRRYASANHEASQWDELGKLDASAEQSCLLQPPTSGSTRFEKRLRYKTRKDKYDVKKKERHISTQPRKDVIHYRSKKRRKDEKKKSIQSSKNIMKTFSSRAVLQDRITVPQPLGPGLFRNGREANLKPVNDLAFTEMYLPEGRKQQSVSKLRPRRSLQGIGKQSKNNKDASTLFTPTEEPVVEEITNPSQDARTSESASSCHFQREARSRKMTNDLPRPTSCQHSQPDDSNRSVQIDECMSRNSIVSKRSGSGVSLDSSNASRATTYYTWSKSPSQPPSVVRERESTATSQASPRPSLTPVSVRRVLISSGVYRGTGIHGYDDRKDDSVREKIHSMAHIGYAQEMNETRIFGREKASKTLTQLELQEADEIDGNQASLMARLQALYPPAWRDHEHDSGDKETETSKMPNDDRRLQTIDYGDTSTDLTNAFTAADGSMMTSKNKLAPQFNHMSWRDGPALQQLAGFGTENEVQQIPDVIESRTQGPSLPLSTISPAMDVAVPLSKPLGCSPPSITELTQMAVTSLVDHVGHEEIDMLVPNKLCPVPQTRNSEQGQILNTSVGTITPESASLLRSVGSTSWLPRLHTPVITSKAHANNIIKDSTKSDLCRGNIATAFRSQGSTMSRHQGFQTRENMSSFIAQIEREARECEHDLTGNDNLDDNVIDLVEDNHYYPETFSLSEDIEILDELASAAFFNTAPEQCTATKFQPAHRHGKQETFDGDNGHAAAASNHDSLARDERQQHTSGHADDFEEEKVEMVAFWRPNHFVRF